METDDPMITAWPLFGLAVKTPLVELRLPRIEDDLVNLAAAARLIQPAGEPEFQMSWMYEPSPQMERAMLQGYWRSLAHWRPESWNLQLAIYVQGRPVGLQTLWAEAFGRVRLVWTGSWLALTSQGRGYGTHARAGALELAFGSLGAAEAHSEYLADNDRSAAVSMKLGYVDNGRRPVERQDRMTLQHYVRLSRQHWLEKRLPNVAVTGVEPCRELFGLPTASA